MERAQDIQKLENTLHSPFTSNIQIIKQWTHDVRNRVYTIIPEDPSKIDYNKTILDFILEDRPYLQNKTDSESSDQVEYYSIQYPSLFNETINCLRRLISNNGQISYQEYNELLQIFSKLQSSILVNT